MDLQPPPFSRKAWPQDSGGVSRREEESRILNGYVGEPEQIIARAFRRAEAERVHLPIRLSGGGDFENAEQVKACIAAARRHPSVHAILYAKRIELIPALVDSPANLHARYSAWAGDEAGEAEAPGSDLT